MPEDLSTPDKSLNELEKEVKSNNFCNHNIDQCDIILDRGGFKNVWKEKKDE